MLDWSDSLPSRLLIALLTVGGLAFGTAAVAAQDAGVQVTQSGDTVVVRNATDATIAGTSNLSAGTNVSVRLQSTGDTQPQFLKTDTVSVADDGSFEADFDLSRQSNGDTFTVTVVSDGETVAETEGVVRASGASTTTAGETGSDAATPGFGPLVGVLAVLAVGAAAARAGRP